MAKKQANADSYDGSKALQKVKHEAFAQAVALEVSAAEAYRKGWPKATIASAETLGPKLARNVQVAFRISHLKAKIGDSAEKKFDLTKDKWLKSLAGIAKKAEASKDFSAATGALAHVGKALSWYEPEVVENRLEIILKRL